MRDVSRHAQAPLGSGREPYAVLIIAGIVLAAVGVACGDFGAILANARLICLSCIGIQ
ncbi:MAG: hypothetical protein BWY92_00792 [Firmicutes bacterium ADurb.BinA052]|nr:MAG: hypothetical protein BWY92_00792 [Firmicutes bacterium ADurb.BinA052]